MQQAMYQLGVKQYKSSAYHPESQDALKHFHQTLKNMLRAYCTENNHDWNQGLHLLLFAARESVQESLGFSPFELVFGRTVRGPLKFLKEVWLAEDSSINLLDQVADLCYRLVHARHFAQKNLAASQQKMKTWYDKRAKSRSFKVGEKVLVLLPIPQQPLQARYFGLYTVIQKVNDVDYIVDTPDRWKSQRLCHINMLKKYQDRESKSASNVATACVVQTVHQDDQETAYDTMVSDFALLCNSDVLDNLDKKLCHLTSPEREEMVKAITEFSNILPDVPGRTACALHNVDVGDATPIKQNPYHVNPKKLEFMRKEVDYMLKHGIIEPSQSKWSSPCLSVPKSDGSYRFCTEGECSRFISNS